jgi:hypothetical protein
MKLLETRDKAEAQGDEMVATDPTRAEDVDQWLDGEFARISTLVEEAEISIERMSSHDDGSLRSGSLRSGSCGRRSGKVTPGNLKLTRLIEKTTTGEGAFAVEADGGRTAGAGDRVREDLKAERKAPTEYCERWLTGNRNQSPRRRVSCGFPSDVDHSWYFGKSLPKLSLPKFDGDPLKWADWSGMFNSMIHSSPMTNAEKIVHMQNSVVGRAKSEISGFGYAGDMYHNAYDTLRERFGKRQFVVRAYIEKLGKLPTLVDGNKNAVFNLASTVHSKFGL